MAIDTAFLSRASQHLKLLHNQVSDHETKLYEAIQKLLEETTDSIKIDRKILSLRDVALNFQYLHFQGPKIHTFNGNIKPWNDIEIKKSLIVAKEIVEKLNISHEELPPDILQWMHN